jgi:hypothetical protein
MQPIQNVIEQSIPRYLIAQASFRFTQIGVDMLPKLLFRQFRWNFAHDEPSSLFPASRSFSHTHHAHQQLFCQLFSEIMDFSSSKG